MVSLFWEAKNEDKQKFIEFADHKKGIIDIKQQELTRAVDVVTPLLSLETFEDIQIKFGMDLNHVIDEGKLYPFNELVAYYDLGHAFCHMWMSSISPESRALALLLDVSNAN